jgi:hypothetical protein
MQTVKKGSAAIKSGEKHHPDRFKRTDVAYRERIEEKGESERSFGVK